MVKFSFELPPREAELLCDILHEYAISIRTEALKLNTSIDFKRTQEWLEAHANLVDAMRTTIAKSST